MRARPNADALLAETSRMLREEVAVDLKGDARFKILMAAHAVSIARRDNDGAEALTQALARVPTDLGKAIRSGRHDGNFLVYQILSEAIAAELAISKPKL